MGSGGNPVKTAEQGVRNTFRDIKDNPFDGIANLATRFFTGGNAGYKNGKFAADFHSTDEILGEVNGRNRKRLETYKTDDLMRENQAAMARDQETQRMANYRADLQASRGAQAIRDTAAARGAQARTGSVAAGGSTLGDEKDFLGV